MADENEIEDPVAQGISDFLRHEGFLSEDGELLHAGVKGMKWGQRKAQFFNNPSAGKALLLGSYGKKSAYKNPEALKKRIAAGRFRIAALGTAAASMGIRAIGQGNPGSLLVTSLLNATAVSLGTTGSIVGAVGAAEERSSR